MKRLKVMISVLLAVLFVTTSVSVMAGPRKPRKLPKIQEPVVVGITQAQNIELGHASAILEVNNPNNFALQGIVGDVYNASGEKICIVNMVYLTPGRNLHPIQPDNKSEVAAKVVLRKVVKRNYSPSKRPKFNLASDFEITTSHPEGPEYTQYSIKNISGYAEMRPVIYLLTEKNGSLYRIYYMNPFNESLAAEDTLTEYFHPDEGETVYDCINVAITQSMYKDN